MAILQALAAPICRQPTKPTKQRSAEAMATFQAFPSAIFRQPTEQKFAAARGRGMGSNPCAVRLSNGGHSFCTQFSCKRGPALPVLRAALNDSSSSPPEVFQGMYGPWSIDSNDVREVLLYRAGLVTTAVTFVLAASRAFLPDDNILSSFIQQSSDVLYVIGAGGLGLSLLLIHIYVTPLKRALQLFWAAGVLGSLVVALKFAAPQDESLVNFVLENPWAIWLVGPLFASLTGLVFKEGLCYGKFEAALLVFVIPAVLLGHLSGLADARVELPLLLAWISLYSVFTARKFTQPIKDDLGDKSIFIFNALPEKEKQTFLEKMESQGMLNKTK